MLRLEHQKGIIEGLGNLYESSATCTDFEQASCIPLLFHQNGSGRNREYIAFLFAFGQIDVLPLEPTDF